MKRLLIINGPNLNLLGQREPDIYGQVTLSDIESNVQRLASQLELSCECFQSNHEGALLECIHDAMGKVDGIVINAAAYTHTSVAIRDALAGVNIPFVEVHISNIYQRESFRHRSLLSDKAVAVISGLGAYSYDAAIRFFAESYFKQQA